jgi:hypothetical protein
MKKSIVTPGLVLVLLFASIGPAQAQTPSIGIFFDINLTQQSAECPESPPGSVLDTLYLALSGFSAPVEGIEYKILFPPEILWLADVTTVHDDMPYDRGLLLGNSNDGASMAFLTPQDASSPVVILEVLILWLCEGCATTNITIDFAAHPATGSLRAVTSELAFEDVLGLTSWVCVTCVFCSPAQTLTNPRAVPVDYAADQCVLDCPSGDGGVLLPGDSPGQHHSPDFDNDGLVDIVDFAEFGTKYMDLIFDPDMDLYCSDNIDLIDFVLFTRHWLHTGSIPVEPTTWGKIKARYSE